MKLSLLLLLLLLLKQLAPNNYPPSGPAVLLRSLELLLKPIAQVLISNKTTMSDFQSSQTLCNIKKDTSGFYIVMIDIVHGPSLASKIYT